MYKRFVQAQELLKRHSQEHLLIKYDAMDDAEKKELLDRILGIDYDLMEELYTGTTLSQTSPEEVDITPVEYVDKDSISEEEKSYFNGVGEEAIRSGKLAVVTMAGGQGTRLGHNGPKGTFVFDKENNVTIFEALMNTLKDAQRSYGVYCKWYIMTSHENNAATIEFFESNDYFGYPKDKVVFFIQDELPMIDTQGKILLDKTGMPKLAANGHGGTLTSMEKAGVLEDMKASGIEWVYVCGVDNVLVKPVDPLFMGMAISKNVFGATKSVAKTDPYEKVGVLCKKNGLFGVVEYTEISEEMRNRKAEDSNLLYGDAYVLFNLFSIAGLEKIAKIKLPYHVAFKKADYMNESGKIIFSDVPNAYKFEMFIFDSFEVFDEILVLRTKREEEFAPIKNAIGNDSPETAIAMYKAFKDGKK